MITIADMIICKSIDDGPPETILTVEYNPDREVSYRDPIVRASLKTGLSMANLTRRYEAVGHDQLPAMILRADDIWYIDRLSVLGEIDEALDAIDPDRQHLLAFLAHTIYGADTPLASRIRNRLGTSTIYFLVTCTAPNPEDYFALLRLALPDDVHLAGTVDQPLRATIPSPTT